MRIYIVRNHTKISYKLGSNSKVLRAFRPMLKRETKSVRLAIIIMLVEFYCFVANVFKNT